MQRYQRVLIVDDHPANVVLLEDILGEEYALATASSGEEALAIAPTFRPTVILLDIMMPGIDGYETCQRIRALAALRHTKIIMVSAKAMVEERLRGYEAGADDYITKPFDEEELLAKVRVYMRLKSMEEMNQLKTNILTLLRHQTYTPLHGVLGPIRTLQADPDLAVSERMMFLDMAEQSAERLLSLFEKVSTLSAMKASEWDFHFVPMDVCEVVQSSIDAIMPQASARQVSIVQKLREPMVTLLDAQQMLQVVGILLENAVQFSPSASEVVIAVQPDNDHVCIMVTDHGKGIAPESLAQVFEEFAHPDAMRYAARQGLSLALAREIVWAHDGSITVDSQKGIETTFTVCLPVAEH